MDLPDGLELPLTRGAPWWYWLAGRPALDFVNTRRERWRRNVETLVTPEDLADWFVQAGLLAAPPRVEAELLGSARALRESINLAVDAVIEQTSPNRDALSIIEGWLPEGNLPQRLVAEEGWRAILTTGAPSHLDRYALGLIARDAAEMLGTDQRDRIRVCASETCSARFYDRSRGGLRRWCSMQACGNAAKARRHRARHPR